MSHSKVLVIGMLDSIHVGRWISQFEGTDTEFVLFPSKKFRNFNPLILTLLARDSKVSVRICSKWVPKKLFGYFDYITKVTPEHFRFNFRARALERLIAKNQFHFIHALEIQGAGYLLDEATPNSQKNGAKLILTNWGSDIYFFENFPEHKRRIERILKKADYYSAECSRDYGLARELGFIGLELPCIPNAGGFKIGEVLGLPTASRRQIIVKCYGGQFGRGELIIRSLREILPFFVDYKVFLYSVTADLLSNVHELSNEFPGRVAFVTQKDPISHRDLMTEFSKSRVYIGASVSDGISTSFLESLVHGTFPIQTDTSCANEWISKGAIGSIVNLDIDEISRSITQALRSDTLVNEAAIKNFKIAKLFLSHEIIKGAALKFYSLS
jgi:glycosyltransferase involved in cell wall biosynthesis